jgi:hypothetical protein
MVDSREPFASVVFCRGIFGNSCLGERTPLASIIVNHDHVSRTRLYVANVRDADFGETLVGGQRSEMVPLPDRHGRNNFVLWNLCEFIVRTKT